MSVVCEHFVTHHCQDLTGVTLEACPHHLPHPPTRRTHHRPMVIEEGCDEERMLHK